MNHPFSTARGTGGAVARLTTRLTTLLLALMICGQPAQADEAMRVLRDAAQIAMEAGEWETAKDALERLEELLPGTASIPFNLGLIAARQGDREAARDAFEKAAQRAPDAAVRSRAHYNLGTLDLEQSAVPAAEDESPDEASERREAFLESALDSFAAALMDDAGNRDARINGQRAQRQLAALIDARRGACCINETNCLRLLPEECELSGGRFAGPATACPDEGCLPPPRPCCLPDASCQMMPDAAQCETMGGVFQGDADDCKGLACPALPGACCLPDETCVVLPAPPCREQGGYWIGLETAGATCEQCANLEDGACCMDDDECEILSFIDCAAAGGQWAGPGTDCEVCEQKDGEPQDSEQQDSDEQSQPSEGEPQDESSEENTEPQEEQDPSDEDPADAEEADPQSPDENDDEDADEAEAAEAAESDATEEKEPAPRMTRAEAERLLQSVRDRERARQEELAKRERGRHKRPEKDW